MSTITLESILPQPFQVIAEYFRRIKAKTFDRDSDTITIGVNDYETQDISKFGKYYQRVLPDHWDLADAYLNYYPQLLNAVKGAKNCGYHQSQAIIEMYNALFESGESFSPALFELIGKVQFKIQKMTDTMFNMAYQYLDICGRACPVKTLVALCEYIETHTASEYDTIMQHIESLKKYAEATRAIYSWFIETTQNVAGPTVWEFLKSHYDNTQKLVDEWTLCVCRKRYKVVLDWYCHLINNPLFLDRVKATCNKVIEKAWASGWDKPTIIPTELEDEIGTDSVTRITDKWIY